MARKLVDLSIYLENDVLSDPPMLAPKIECQKHADTMPRGGNLRRETDNLNASCSPFGWSVSGFSLPA